MNKKKFLLLFSVGLCIVNLILACTFLSNNVNKQNQIMEPPDYSSVTKDTLSSFHDELTRNKILSPHTNAEVKGMKITFLDSFLNSFEYELVYVKGEVFYLDEFNYISDIENDFQTNSVTEKEITTTFEQVCGVFEYIEDNSLHSDLNTYTYGGAFDSTKSLEYDHLYLNGITISFDASSLKDKHLIIQSSNDENIETVVHHYIDF